MRRAAGITSTSPASTTKLTQLSVRGCWSLWVHYLPSALVHTSRPHWSVSSRRVSSKTAFKPSSWPSARQDSYWKSPLATKSNDGRLGQEEGQRLIEAAFSETSSAAKATPRVSKKWRKSRNSGNLEQPGRDHDVSMAEHQWRHENSDQTLHDKKSARSRHPAALDSVTSQILEGRRMDDHPTLPTGGSCMESTSSSLLNSTAEKSPSTPASVFGPGITIIPEYPASTSRQLASERGQVSKILENRHQLLPISERHDDTSMEHASACARVAGSENELQQAEDMQSQPDSNISSSTPAGIQILPLRSLRNSTFKAVAGPSAFTQFSWKPQIRDTFQKRGSSELEANTESDTGGHNMSDNSASLQHEKPEAAPAEAAQEDLNPRSPLLQHNHHSRLIAEIWEKASDLHKREHLTAVQAESWSPVQKSVEFIDVKTADAETLALTEFQLEGRPKDLLGWRQLAEHMQRNNDSQRTWEALAPLMRDHCGLLTRPDAGILRDVLVEAAVGNDTRLSQLVGMATTLRDRNKFEWPDLYGNVMYRLLEEVEPVRALFWHSHLYSLFPPSEAVFAALLSHFVVDGSTEIQSALMKLHDSNKDARLYDTIITRLFDFGQSTAARRWRKRLLSVNDFPLSDASGPFLRFLSAYYPLLELTAEEQRLLVPRTAQASHVKTRSEAELEAIKKSIHGDHIVAKWFASTWTTSSFAIDLVHRFGVNVLGPLALQSLGLRDPGAKHLADNLTQLEGLGIALAPTTYCRVIAYFARQGEDELLEGVLACDVHPDEFEDIETVRMLALAAQDRQDTTQYNLMRGIEKAIQVINIQDDHDDPSPSEDLGAFQSALSRTQGDIAEALDLTFDRFGYHPLRWLHPRRCNGSETVRLAQAIAALRQAVVHDVPIPLDYWKRILYNLGRLGRIRTLDQVSLELVQMYGASNCRRIPVHPNDLPPLRTRQPSTVTAANSRDKDFNTELASGGSGTDGLELWQRALNGRATGVQELGYVPSDLPFTHRQHPIRKIFRQRLQRNIIRWGFDNALRLRHPVRGASWRDRSMTKSSWRAAQLSERGIGQGLRILAKLRDNGVVIDAQVVQSEVLRRIISADFPGRSQAPWMDHHELAIPHVVRLVRDIWGPGIFDSSEEVRCMLRERRAKIRQHYWKNRLLRASRDTQIPEDIIDS